MREETWIDLLLKFLIWSIDWYLLFILIFSYG